MLSSRTIEIIKSTAPVLEEHGTTITKHFYKTMFAAHPELLNLFNHANQSQGRQQTALANVVYAAALHIDKLESILPVVKQIAHKHRSLGVKADQYPIVGKYLLGAIKDVLGDAATDDILGAWAEAYGIIANVFIQVEEGMYEHAEKQDGGWAGFRAFRVARKVAESDVVTSFYLVPADGGALAAFEPGQYISVRLDIPGEANTHIRQYSLSDAPGKPYYRISVKREDALPGKPAGKVSSYLHAQVEEGDALHLSAPAGEFVLDLTDTRPLVLISGGVGLTPMVSMLKAAAEAQPGREITFIHAARSGAAHALRQEAEEVAANGPHVSAHWCYSRPSASDRETGAFHKEGYVDLFWLQQVVPTTEASFYFCGPTAFMRTVYAALRAWGIGEERMRFEFFGPSGSLLGAEAETKTNTVEA
ncbi:NO-inducible flavohemoprotein [Cohnella hashimotonis]|uniref:Flavohemoprotein n=1 Tax=Cohnella hashimotonis TaxID=2826895 RepID=A0ABT6TSP1_9BACL|nr:NO-inducible flavohemoprotein [Cohnella hashimotonis]MDI4649867.1 NO-inducible flavohemoprotein [Cohnella hashimotonis]